MTYLELSVGQLFDQLHGRRSFLYRFRDYFFIKAYLPDIDYLLVMIVQRDNTSFKESRIMNCLAARSQTFVDRLDVPQFIKQGRLIKCPLLFCFLLRDVRSKSYDHFFSEIGAFIQPDDLWEMFSGFS